MIRRFVIACGFILSAATVATAGAAPSSMEERLSQARALYETAKKTTLYDDWEPTFQAFLSLAKDGSPEAQETVGRLYGLGLGVKHDRCEETFWLDRAARVGRPWAQYLLGWSYWNGDGVIRDHNLAYLWFMTAARNGWAEGAHYADILAQSELREAGRVAALDGKLRTWRPEDQPPARIIRLPNIWGINWVMAVNGLHPCHFRR